MTPTPTNTPTVTTIYVFANGFSCCDGTTQILYVPQAYQNLDIGYVVGGTNGNCYIIGGPTSGPATVTWNGSVYGTNVDDTGCSFCPACPTPTPTPTKTLTPTPTPTPTKTLTPTPTTVYSFFFTKACCGTAGGVISVPSSFAIGTTVTDINNVCHQISGLSAGPATLTWNNVSYGTTCASCLTTNPCPTPTPTPTPTKTLTPTPTITPTTTGGVKWLVAHCCGVLADRIIILPVGTIAGQIVTQGSQCWTTISTSTGTAVGAGIDWPGTNNCASCNLSFPCKG